MKTAKQIITEIAESGELHKIDCICARCKNGRETFLLPSDIEAIQRDALLFAQELIMESSSRGGALNKIMAAMPNAA